MQYTQEQVERFFADHGCRLLSQYVNTKSPLRYVGTCGHEAVTASFEVARRPSCTFKCEKCSPKTMYTDDEVADFVRREGCELLGIDNVRHEKNGRLYKTIRITCACGHEHQLTFEKFKIGRGRVCPKCAKPRAERHHAYNPNLTDEDRLANRDVWEATLWRRNVYARDGYVCRRCGSDKGGDLVAHHLNGWSDYPEQRFDINNGITLCEACHKSFHGAYGFGHNTVQQYLAWIERDNTEVIAETKKSATP